MPLFDVEGQDQLVPVGIASLPTGIRPIARDASIASTAPDVAERAGHTRDARCAVLTFMFEEAKRVSVIDARLYAQVILGLAGALRGAMRRL